jgi:hypothetical protein
LTIFQSILEKLEKSVLTVGGGWVTEKQGLQEGGQGAADTQLAPTSWDEAKNFDCFLRSCLMTILLIPKTIF